MMKRLASKYQLLVQDVYKSYGTKKVLDDIDLAVRRGEFCTVVGPSGCGKSTLLRLILGQEQPCAGTISIDGEPVGVPDTERGIVYQNYSLFPHLSVLENVILGRTLRLSPLQAWRRRGEFVEEAMRYLRRVGLAEHARKQAGELSGGMRQRVAIVQALVAHPKILLMDEPFGALDPETREDMQLFIIEMWEETGMTIFFVTHDLEEALFLGTRNFVLSQHYCDDRGDCDGVQRGAKIVADYHLQRQAGATTVKRSARFLELAEAIRQEGFNPAVRQHLSQFNLLHPDSFRTVNPGEAEVIALVPELGR